MNTGTRNLSQFADMIRFAAAPEKLKRIQIWLENYLEDSEIWNHNQKDPEILRYRMEMKDAIDKLIKTNGADKSKAIRVFTNAAHFELAVTADAFKDSKEVEAFVSLLEWTLANTWVIHKVDSKAKLPDEEIPRWLLTHKQKVQEIKNKK